MPRTTRSLAGRLALIQTSFLVVALASIALTLWVSWQLEGGAGAINEAGRMRMASYRMGLTQRDGSAADLQRDIAEFEAMVARLQHGDATRPLFVPNVADCRERLAEVVLAWPRLRASLHGGGAPAAVRAETDALVARIEALVGAIEHTIAARTALLGGMCLGLVVLVAAAAAVFGSGSYLWIIQPLQQLRDGLARMAAHDFAPRIAAGSAVEEFESLADGFNRMGEALQSSYRDLEAKVAEKTADLEAQNARLAALYDVAKLAGSAAMGIEALGQGFANELCRIAGADAAAVRLAGADNERLLLLGQAHLPAGMRDAERCVRIGECACGEHLGAANGARVIPIGAIGPRALNHCEAAGYRTMVAIPMRTAQRTIGEIELFYRAGRVMPEDERQLLDVLAGHVAVEIENLRLAARDREMAVSEERNLLAQELHDSIAQSLAFLKIQVQLLRKARVERKDGAIDASIGEIDTGVRECYADVRELLLHFRTRPGHEDIEHALRSTLSKFELQSGLHATFAISEHGVPLPADEQVQVLHVVQEALSNVRKHAGATHVELRVTQAPRWRFEIIDDGRGFDAGAAGPDETHVGLRIMRERAQRIGAALTVHSVPGGGTRIVLELPERGPQPSTAVLQGVAA